MEQAAHDPDTDTNVETLQDALLRLAAGGWRLGHAFRVLVQTLDPSDQSRYLSAFRFHQKTVKDTLATFGYSLVDLEGHPFDVGIAANALNVGDFCPADCLVVDQVLEPTIMRRGQVARQGTVLLKKVTL